MRIAIISDIHGNIDALETVREDIRAWGADAIVNCGDSLYGPLDPSAVAARLRDSRIISLRGHADRFRRLGDSFPYDPIRAFVARQLDGDDRRWMHSLRSRVRIGPDGLACHGTPDADDLYLLERVTRRGVKMREPSFLQGYLHRRRCRLIVCGHSHLARIVALSAGEMIVNAGSVGLPAFRELWPFPHVIEAGSPHARYVRLTGENGRWTPEIVLLAYDWEAAARRAERRRRADWAFWLRTGLAGA